MTREYIADLKTRLESGQVMFIVGSGISIGATANAQAASWNGLLKLAITRSAQLDPSLTDKWVRRREEDLDSGDVDTLVPIAELLTTKLGGRQGGEFRAWLRSTVGSLKTMDASVLHALRDSNVLLATTNYDGLLEEATGRLPTTWRNKAQVERILRGEEDRIFHLHGHFEEPESVVFGIRSYDDILGDLHTQATIRALLLHKTLVFAGCGKGLTDPNFSALRKWLREVYARSEFRHYLLTTSPEANAMDTVHMLHEERIATLTYGDDHSLLGPFLRSLGSHKKNTTQTDLAIAHRTGSRLSLPPVPNCFGRANEIETAVGALLAPNPKWLPILGPPGIGKSAITICALHDERVRSQFKERRWFVRCDGSASPEGIISDIAKAIDVDLGPGLEGRVLSELNLAPGAIALDNFEAPWEADPRGSEDLLVKLAAIQHLACIVSIRGEERPYLVPWIEPIRVRTLPVPGVHARNAFLAVAGRSFESDPYLDHVIQMTDGVPLALNLLGHAAEGESTLEGLWKNWLDARATAVATPGRRDRLTNLHVSFELSIQSPRMTPSARRALSLLSHFPDGIEHSHYARAMSATLRDAPKTLRAVALAYDDGTRLRVLAPIRTHVRELYPPSPQDLEHCFQTYFEFARAGAKSIGRTPDAVSNKTLANEFANIESLILEGLSQKDPTQAIRAACHLAEFSRISGIGSVHSTVAARDAARNHKLHALAADASLAIALHQQRRSTLPDAIRFFSDARARFRRTGNKSGETHCIQGIADVYHLHSENRAATRLYQLAFKRYGAIRDNINQANCILSLGDIQLDRSRLDEAKSHFERARVLFTRARQRIGVANSILGLASVELLRGSLRKARVLFDAARASYEQLGDILGQANSRLGITDVLYEMRELSATREQLDIALLLYKRVGVAHGEAACLVRQGKIELAQRPPAPEEAKRLFELALATFRAAHNESGEADCYLGLAKAHRATSKFAAAERSLRDARARYARVQSTRGMADCLLELGDIAYQRKRLASARTLFEQSLILWRRACDSYAIGEVEARLFEVARLRSDAQRHAVLARRAWNSIGRSDLVNRLRERVSSRSNDNYREGASGGR